MNWRDRGRYRSNLIWVIQMRNGKWIASAAALPAEGVLATPGPGDQCVPGEFDSEDDAVAAAKQYIDEKQRQRGTC
jgi:hypothetical protein